MAIVTVEVSGNLHKLDEEIDHDKRRIEVDESELGDLGELVRCFGFGDFKEHRKSEKLLPDAEILVYSGFVNPDKSISYHCREYTLGEDNELHDSPNIYNPRKILKGINWWYQNP